MNRHEALIYDSNKMIARVEKAIADGFADEEYLRPVILELQHEINKMKERCGL